MQYDIFVVAMTALGKMSKIVIHWSHSVNTCQHQWSSGEGPRLRILGSWVRSPQLPFDVEHIHQYVPGVMSMT